MSTQLKGPIWIFRHTPEFSWGSDAHRRIRGGAAAAERAYGALGVAPATTTGGGKLLTIGGIHDTGTSKWGCVPLANEQ